MVKLLSALIIFVSLLDYSLAVSFGAGPGVYGIAGPSYQDGDNTLVKYNTRTGETRTVQTVNPAYLTGEALGCLDQVNGIWYFVYEEVLENNTIVTGLYPYDLKDLSTHLDPVLLPMFRYEFFVGAGEACTSDPNTGDIYVFGGSASDLKSQLLVRVTRDSDNKVETTIVGSYSNVNDIPLLSGQPTVYDSKRNMIWVAAEYGNNTNAVQINYYYINAMTGVLENTITYYDWPLDTCSYDPNLDLLVGVQWQNEEVDGNFTYALRYADPVTLQITKTFPPIKEWCDYGAQYALNFHDSIGYYLIYKNPYGSCISMNGTLYGHLVSIDITTGAMLDSPKICEFGNKLTSPWDIVYWGGPRPARNKNVTH